VTYGREALRRLREKQAQAVGPVEHPDGKIHARIDDVPPDAPMDDATLTAWNGERFVAYETWLATAPLVREEKRLEDKPAIPADADCVTGECGGTRVWLVKEGARWLMWVGSRTGGRRRDFATPYLGHAIRTAELWYGAPGGGWRAENNGNGGGVAA
jgi:hypothetical protein